MMAFLCFLHRATLCDSVTDYLGNLTERGGGVCISSHDGSFDLINY